MARFFTRPQALADLPTHYCPGCTHGVIHRLIGEVIDELNMQGHGTPAFFDSLRMLM